MSAPDLSNLSCRHSRIRDAFSLDDRQRFASQLDPRLVKVTTSRPFGQVILPFLFNNITSQVRMNHCRRESTCCSIQMACLDEKLADRSIVLKPADVLVYDLVQGADVRWSYISDKSAPEPPTAVLLHGILGCRKNWGTFARRLAKEFPKWQFLLVDLRCQGDSASLTKRGPHSVASAALDVLKLLGQMRLTP